MRLLLVPRELADAADHEGKQARPAPRLEKNRVCRIVAQNPRFSQAQ
jgi:hypothetical protein